METLPPEVLRRIAECLAKECRLTSDKGKSVAKSSFAGYAAISRQWQSIVESINFRSLRLTPANLAVAEEHNYLTPTRLGLVRSVDFNVRFSRPATAFSRIHVAGHVAERVAEHVDHQAEFNAMVRQLFDVLARIPCRDEPSISLDISIPHMPEHWDMLFRGQSGPVYLDLFPDWDQDIPALPAVSFFRVGLASEKFLFEPSSINSMASKMTRLKKAAWGLSDGERDAELRIRHRTRFAYTLDLIPKSLQHFTLSYERDPPLNMAFKPLSIVPPASPGDILSREFYQFTQRDGLEYLSLTASVDSTILFPREWSVKQGQPYWPTLRELRIHLNDILPSGQRVYVRDPCGDWASSSDSGDDDMTSDRIDEYYRSFPAKYNQAIVDDFALAAARQACHMPVVEEIREQPGNRSISEDAGAKR
ncbi:hypothetical protein ACJ41O_014998 [Fusarium nematophilum]